MVYEDLFENVIICKECGKKMEKHILNKNGFQIRAMQCPKCSKKIYHPGDVEEFKRFSVLRNKPFSVKLRMVGNSYTVSIPREIIDFFNEAEEHMQSQMKEMHKMVTLALEDANSLSLMFNEDEKSKENFINKHSLRKEI